MDEFDYIKKYFKPLTNHIARDLNDDAAVYKPLPKHEIVISTDSLVEGVHFFGSENPIDIAKKALRVNLSDLAAKGASPIGYLLSVALPKTTDEIFFKNFSSGLKEVQDLFDFKLLGGDTVVTEGPIVITATLIGELPVGRMIKRDGAKIGNSIWVSGTLGDSYLGFKAILEGNLNFDIIKNDVKHFKSAYYRPVPRLIIAKQLRNYATSCIDISDGLVADAFHLSDASNVKLIINFEDIPISDQSERWLKGQSNYNEAFKNFLNWGDDYELLFTSDSSNDQLLKDTSTMLDLKLTKIGIVSEGEGVDIIQDKKLIKFDASGHKHVFVSNKVL